jgi:hypothetical protein
MYILYTIVHGEHTARLFSECKQLLQLSLDTKARYWYLYEECTIIFFFLSKKGWSLLYYH